MVSIVEPPFIGKGPASLAFYEVFVLNLTTQIHQFHVQHVDFFATLNAAEVWMGNRTTCA
jgi:hypothetical protein